MGKWFRAASVAAKLRLISLLAALSTIGVAGYLLALEYQVLQSERERATRQSVQIAYGVLQAAHEQEQAGKLDRKTAQEQAIAQIKQLRYGQGDYFWINDMHPTMVMHPTNPKLDGKDLTDNKDPDGKRLFVAFVEQVKQSGEGFVRYKWPKPGAQQPVEKLSFVKGFAPWGWVIGTGIYLDDLYQDFASRTGVAMGIVALSVALIAAAFAFVSRWIVGGVGRAVQVAEGIAGGNLSQDIRAEGGSELAALLHALSTMQGALASIVRDVQAAATSIGEAAAQSAAGNSDLSARTERTAAELQGTASSVEQMTASVRAAADQAVEAGRLADSASAEATDGGTTVRRVAQTMDGIAESSKRIGDVTSVIDSIAFQTNILALNAAVEAARAGEHGRGFAVVASEVRALATRCSESAREINALIQGSVAKVAEGTQYVAQASHTMERAVNASRQVAQVVGTMATSAVEQRAGIEQVNNAVTVLDQSTQQNAALVEQSAAAAQAIAEQAQRLVAAVQVFRLAPAAHG